MKKKHKFCLFALIFLITAFSGALGKINHFLINGLLFFLAVFLIKRYSTKKSDLFWILSPTIIIFSITVIHAAIISRAASLPIPIISIISVFVALFIYALKRHKITFTILYIALLFPLSYFGYPNWLNFTYDDENPVNREFPKELILKDEVGNTFNLSDNKGKVIILDLWSTSCGACFKKFPDFEKQKNNYKNDPKVKFYTVNLALKRDSAINVSKYVENYSFETLYADKNSWEVLENKSVPKLLILNKDFKIVYKGRMHEKWYHFYKNFNSIIDKLKNE